MEVGRCQKSHENQRQWAWAQGSRGKEETQMWVFPAAGDTKWPFPLSEIRRLRLGEEVTYPRLLDE